MKTLLATSRKTHLAGVVCVSFYGFSNYCATMFNNLPFAWLRFVDNPISTQQHNTIEQRAVTTKSQGVFFPFFYKHNPSMAIVLRHNTKRAKIDGTIQIQIQIFLHSITSIKKIKSTTTSSCFCL